MTYPHVVCLMPTRNRPEMARRAIHDFLRQDYQGEIALVIFDDSDRPMPPCACVEVEVIQVRDQSWFAPGDRSIVYDWRAEVRNCATKRNDMVRRTLAAYRDDPHPVFALWDDDDLYGPSRLRRQVEALLAKPEAECCLFMPWTLYDVERGIVAMNSVHTADGTAAFTVRHWERAAWDEEIDGYSGPARLTHQMQEAPNTIVTIDGADDYIVMRHGGNHTGAPSTSYRGGPWKKPPPCSAADLDERIRTAAACRSPR